ncbi:flagellar basal body rod protein FlgB [Desulfurobacterium sp.]|uniref:flagellar basal body rod protein FlgB n=1 Tax=Desulfurobacterium sp. TaxID=2004706 RepID=UPI00262EA20D|nr:flagellar basal body rod protein FlgB [Desulfurobacterium sp.]
MEIFKPLDNLETGASYFFRRSEVIQGNIANADTPGYKPKDLVFEKELEENLHLKRTDPRHMDPSFPPVRFRLVNAQDYSGYDDNRVNLDKELAKLAETNLMIRLINESLKKEIGKLKLVIQGR